MNKSTSHKKTLRAFTLVELLVVIAIIAILAALLLPAISAAKTAAMVKKARVQENDIVNAVTRYDTTYSRFPTTQTSTSSGGTNNDFTYGGSQWGNPAIIAGTTPGVYNASNSEVVAILMDITTFPGPGGLPTANAGHAKNPQQIKFLNANLQGDASSPGVGTDLVYRDPWGNPYIISMDLNYNETTLDAFYGSAVVSKQTTTPPSGAAGFNGLTDLTDPAGNANDYEYHGGVMVWSLGPDGKADMTKPANKGVNRDNVISWGD